MPSLSTEPQPETGRDVNNHIHTTYSFSPYSPTAAVWFARAAGLCTCGLMDHDSIAGAPEFLAAAEAAKMSATIGIECRVSFKDTPFGDRKLNNPDQKGVVYMALHGVPHNKAAEINEFFAPYRVKRNERNKKMVAAINEMMGKYGVTIDFRRTCCRCPTLPRAAPSPSATSPAPWPTRCWRSSAGATSW